ncbi:MAG: ZIP family metal transporter [Candidatus Woesearchaeota archaeon]|nr:MAG: ZIP family metal transporter [Candidatus Woesearchaeota archaeon]
MSALVYALIASFIVSLVSFAGAILFIWKEQKVNKYLLFFIAFAAGMLLGTSFFHLIPESVELRIEKLSSDYVLPTPDAAPLPQNDLLSDTNPAILPSYFVLIGILLFFLIEKAIHWHHHHDVCCDNHPVTTLSLVGDGLHNLIDGLLIGAAFHAGTSIGIVTTIAIIFHEIPQEIGDLAILLHNKFSKGKALVWNFISALFSVVGAAVSFYILGSFENALPVLIALTAGGFIYISLADIVPEIHSHKKSVLPAVVFIAGIIISFLLAFVH